MDAMPGTAEFAAAIDRAATIGDVDALRTKLDFSASEFCRRADVNESWYSTTRRNNRAMRTRTLRRLKEALRRLDQDRAAGPKVVPLRAVE